MFCNTCTFVIITPTLAIKLLAISKYMLSVCLLPIDTPVQGKESFSKQTNLFHM